MTLTVEEKALVNTELTTDPQTIGYAAPIAAGDVGALSNLLNAPDPSAGTIQRTSVSLSEVHSAVSANELDSMATNAADTTSPLHVEDKARLEQWKMFLAAYTDGVVKGEGNIVAILKKVFPNGSTSLSNIANLQTKFGSRIEVVIDREYAVTYDDLRGLLA